MKITPLTPVAGDSEYTLLAKILTVLNNGGGGGGGGGGTSGPADPVFTPTGTFAIYKNTTTGRIWVWDPINLWQ